MAPLSDLERYPPVDRLASSNRQHLIDINDEHTLAPGIVDAIRDPLLVLDRNLRVITANRAFFQTVSMTRQSIEDRPVYRVVGTWRVLMSKADQFWQYAARYLASSSPDRSYTPINDQAAPRRC